MNLLFVCICTSTDLFNDHVSANSYHQLFFSERLSCSKSNQSHHNYHLCPFPKQYPISTLGQLHAGYAQENCNRHSADRHCCRSVCTDRDGQQEGWSRSHHSANDPPQSCWGSTACYRYSKHKQIAFKLHTGIVYAVNMMGHYITLFGSEEVRKQLIVIVKVTITGMMIGFSKKYNAMPTLHTILIWWSYPTIHNILHLLELYYHLLEL